MPTKKKATKKRTKNNIKTIANSKNAKNVKNKVADGIEDAKEFVQNKYTQIKNNLNEEARIRELKKLAPIYSSDIKNNLYSIPNVIRIVESDKEHMKSELCKGSIGWDEKRREIPYITVEENRNNPNRTKYYNSKIANKITSSKLILNYILYNKKFLKYLINIIIIILYIFNKSTDNCKISKI